MSALTNLDKKVESTNKQIDVLADQASILCANNDLDNDALKKQIKELENPVLTIINDLENVLIIEANKLVEKMNQKDPVTGSDRYGTKAKSKILSLRDQLDEIRTKCDILVQNIQTIRLKISFNSEEQLESIPNSTEISRKAAVVPIRSIDKDMEFKNNHEFVKDSNKDESVDQVQTEKARLAREKKIKENEKAAKFLEKVTIV